MNAHGTLTQTLSLAESEGEFLGSLAPRGREDEGEGTSERRWVGSTNYAG